MIKRILKWTGIIILTMAVLLTTVTAMRQNLKYEAPMPRIKASKDTAVIAKGRHIVLGPGHCADCHSPVRNVDSVLKLGQDPPLSGGHVFDLPFGKFYTRNITPDSATGIGAMTDGEIARLLRYGVKRNGTAALPFMPFQNMSDEDLTAIVSYLRSVKPVSHKVPDHEYTIVGNIIKAYMLKPEGPTEPIVASVPEDTTAAYGRHLVMAVANCNECHTKRDEIGRYVGEHLSGGNVFKEKGKSTLVTPNLTPDPQTGRITDWSEETFIQRFRMNRVIEHSHMPWESYSRMTDNELKAIYKYLRSIKPVHNEVQQVIPVK